MTAILFETVDKRVGAGWGLCAQALVPINLKGRRFWHGVESGFYIQKDNIGIKTFYTESDALHSFKMQKRAAKFKAAPEIKSRNVFPVIVKPWSRELCKGSEVKLILKWAYRTQVADTEDDGAFDIKSLERKLRKAKVNMGDLHPGNIGMIGKETVRLDFGRISTT